MPTYTSSSLFSETKSSRYRKKITEQESISRKERNKQKNHFKETKKIDHVSKTELAAKKPTALGLKKTQENIEPSRASVKKLKQISTPVHPSKPADYSGRSHDKLITSGTPSRKKTHTEKNETNAQVNDNSTPQLQKIIESQRDFSCDCWLNNTSARDNAYKWHKKRKEISEYKEKLSTKNLGLYKRKEITQELYKITFLAENINLLLREGYNEIMTKILIEGLENLTKETDKKSIKEVLKKTQENLSKQSANLEKKTKKIEDTEKHIINLHGGCNYNLHKHSDSNKNTENDIKNHLEKNIENLLDILDNQEHSKHVKTTMPRTYEYQSYAPSVGDDLLSTIREERTQASYNRARSHIENIIHGNSSSIHQGSSPTEAIDNRQQTLEAATE